MKKKLEPQSNDWLFHCPNTLRTSRIVAALQAENQPLTVFSTKDWQETWRVGNDILRAYGYPASYFYQPGQKKMSWDAISDWMFVTYWEEKPRKGLSWQRETFLGELILLRDCTQEVSVNLAGLVGSVENQIKHAQSLSPIWKGRLLVVLAGWTAPVLEARVGGHRYAWIVNPLPGQEQV